jgi:PAS domain S-box-containing protein
VEKSSVRLIQERINYLRENTDFGPALFESLIGCAIIAADFDGNIIAYNEGARQIYGYAPEEIIGKENIGVFLPKGFIEAGKLPQLISELISKERFSYEGEKVRKDGSRFPAQVLLTLIKERNSKVVGFIEIVQDLTERKRIDETLQASEAHLRKIIEKNADGILIVDRNGVVCFANPAAEALWGRKGEELRGQLFGFPLVAGETTELDIVHGKVGKIIAEMRVVEMDWGGKSSCLASVRDITERKNTEEEREKMILQLENALEKVKTLSGLLPICSFCKKIRDDDGYWKQIETYIEAHSEAEFSHSMCQECAGKHYPEIYSNKSEQE